jgi:hypothetical protein
MWTTFKKVMENRMSLVRLDGYKQLMEKKADFDIWLWSLG